MHIDEKVIFIHNLRAAGTATRRALVFGNDPNKSISYPGNVPTSVSNNSKHLFASLAREKIPPEVWAARFKFAIVRNPWDRVVSLYGLFRRPREAKFQSSTRETKWGDPRWKLNKIIFALDREGINLEIPKIKKVKLYRWALELGFKDWLKFCDDYRWNAVNYVEQPHARKRQRPITRIPQVEWFDGLDKVFKFEQLEEMYDVLVDLGYPVPVIENQTERDPWQAYYDDADYDLVAEAFKLDIERFGYGIG